MKSRSRSVRKNQSGHQYAQRVLKGYEEIFRRAEALENSGELGCALLLRFIPYECAVKMITYLIYPSADWPKKFDGRNKGMKILKGINLENYDRLNSLRNKRNLIAHYALRLDEKEYLELKGLVMWANKSLQKFIY